MGIAVRAADFGTAHEVAAVVDLDDGVFRNRLEKARPARAGIIFGIGGEKRRPATYAIIGAFALFGIVGVGKGALGAVFASHMKLLGRQFGAPLGVGNCFHIGHFQTRLAC